MSDATGAPEPVESSSSEWIILTPDVQINSVEDLKNVYFQKGDTVINAYDYMLQQMGIAAAEDAQKQEEHRKKTMKEIEGK